MASMRIALNGAAFAALLVSATAVRADNAATGMWIDHTGRGGVEITDCGGKLCGHVAWLKDTKNNDQCGKQIIGNVESVGTNKWDHGWIYDPDSGSKYDVAVSTVGADKLRVVGYAGTKWLSETYAWKRAPADLQKCSKDGTAAQATPPAAGETNPETAKTADAKTEDTKAGDAKTGPGKTAETTIPADTAKPTDTAKPADTTANADTGNDDNKADDSKTDGKREDAGKIVARIVEALDDNADDSADDSTESKPKHKRTCKMNVPYVDMTVSYPCD